MSLLRRRMMMAASAKEPDVPTDELDYLTIIPLHEEEETYYIRTCHGKVGMFEETYTQLAPLYYRINNGEWIEVMLPDNEYDIYIYINLKKGDELQLKCTTYDLNPGDYNEFYYVALQNNVKFNVRGTPMSLIYGDDFKENNVAVEYSLYELFYGCEGLTEILNPKTFLPCTILEPYCYSYMFHWCTNLVNAPELPATTLADGCYLNMFNDCTKLNYIKMLATDISAEECLGNWVNGVSSIGTFVKHPDMTNLSTGENGIPSGWTVVNDGEESGGMNATLLVNQDNGQTGIDVYNYMINNSIVSNPPGESDRFIYDWYAKDNDNIMLSGTFDGITLDNVRVTKAINYPHSGVNRWFELNYEGKGSFIYALLHKDGRLDCYDDE